MDLRYEREAELGRHQPMPAAHRDAARELFSSAGSNTCGNVTCVTSTASGAAVDERVTVVFWGNPLRDLLDTRCEAVALNLSCARLETDNPRLRQATPSKPFGMRVEIELPMPTRAQLSAPLRLHGGDVEVDLSDPTYKTQLAHCEQFKSWSGRSARMSVAQIVDISNDWNDAMRAAHGKLAHVLRVVLGVRYLLYFPVLDVYYASYNVFKSTLYGMYAGTFALRGGLKLFDYTWGADAEGIEQCTSMVFAHNVASLSRVLWSCYCRHGSDVMSPMWCKFGVRSNAMARPLSGWIVELGDNLIPLIRTSPHGPDQDEIAASATVVSSVLPRMTSGADSWLRRALAENDFEVFSSETLAAEALAMVLDSDDADSERERVVSDEERALQQLTEVVVKKKKSAAPVIKKKVVVKKKSAAPMIKKKVVVKKKSAAPVIKKKVMKKRQREDSSNAGCSDVPRESAAKRQRVDEEFDEEWCDFGFATIRATKRARECELMDAVSDDEQCSDEMSEEVQYKSRAEQRREVEQRERNLLHARTLDDEMEAEELNVVVHVAPRDSMETANDDEDENEDEEDEEENEGDLDGNDSAGDSDSDDAAGDEERDDANDGADDEQGDAGGDEQGDASDDAGDEDKSDDDEHDSGADGDRVETDQSDQSWGMTDSSDLRGQQMARMSWNRADCVSAPQLDDTLTSGDLRQRREMHADSIQERMDAFSEGLQLNNHVLHAVMARIDELLKLDKLDAAAAELTGVVNKLLRGDQGRPSKRTTDNIARLSSENEAITAVCTANAAAIQNLAKNYKTVLQLVVKIEESLQQSVMGDGAEKSESSSGRQNGGATPRVIQILTEVRELMKDLGARVTALEFNIGQESRNSIRIRYLEGQMESMLKQCQEQQQEIRQLRHALGTSGGGDASHASSVAVSSPSGIRSQRVRIGGGVAFGGDSYSVQQFKLVPKPPMPAGAVEGLAVPHDGYESSSPHSSASHHDNDTDVQNDVGVQQIYDSFFGDATLGQHQKGAGATTDDNLFAGLDGMEPAANFLDDFNGGFLSEMEMYDGSLLVSTDDRMDF